MRGSLLSRRLSVLLLIAVLALTGCTIVGGIENKDDTPNAESYTYDPASGMMPHEEGQIWERRGDDATGLASVQDSVLHVNTIGDGDEDKGKPSIYWRILGDNPGWENVHFPVTVEFKLKINEAYGGRAFYFAVTDSEGRHATVNFSETDVAVAGGDKYEIDTTEWHTYLFEITPDDVILFLDGGTEPVMTWSTATNDKGSQIIFGDGSVSWSGDYQLAYFKHTIYRP